MMTFRERKEVKKRNGSIVVFDETKIVVAVKKAFDAVSQPFTKDIQEKVMNNVDELMRNDPDCNIDSGLIEIEAIQDIVELALIKAGFRKIAKEYSSFREIKRKERQAKMKLLNVDVLSDVEKRYPYQALKIFKERYLLKDNEGNTCERLDDLFKRVAVASGIMEVLYDEEWYDKTHPHLEWDYEYGIECAILPNNYVKYTFDHLKDLDYKNINNHEDCFKFGEFIINPFHVERLWSRYNELFTEGYINISFRTIHNKLYTKDFQKKYIPKIQQYYDLMANKIFLPNTPALMNAGTKLNMMSACFVLKVDDDMQDISKLYHDVIMISKSGGGVGCNYSNLRPNNARIKSTGGVSSGPISFMSIVDALGNVIKQGSKRRSASMGIMNISHPDSLTFIKIKNNITKQFENFNISLNTTDKFFECFFLNKDFDLEFNNELYRRINVREMMNMITNNAHETGDPGMVFSTALNSNNLLQDVYGLPINCTNPCFHPDTMIETVYGQMKIKDIKEPIKVYTYRNGKLSTAMASPSWKTHENANTLKITMNNGKSLIVTPNHKLLKSNNDRNGKDSEWVESKDLNVGDKIVSLCRARRGACYSGVKLSTEDNRAYQMEHRFICKESYGEIPVGYDVHHIDGNTYNNSLDNMELLPHDRHAHLTAMTQPNSHQVTNLLGQFVTHENSKKGVKTIIPMPNHLRSNHMRAPRIVKIEHGPITDVYDISVKDTHCLIANGIVAHNCGEQSLYPDGSCTLGSINLTKFVENGRFNTNEFMAFVSLCTQFLDNVVDANKYPTNGINDIAKKERRIGLGYMGLGDAMTQLDIPYNSEKGFTFIEYVTAMMSGSSLYTSSMMANIKGSFPFYYTKEYENNRNKLPINATLNPELMNSLQSRLDIIKEYLEDNSIINIKEYYDSIPISDFGLRNSNCTTIAPTGTLAMFVDVSYGIEPVFSHGYMKNVTLGSFSYINKFLEAKLRGLGIYSEQLIDEIINKHNGRIQGIEEIPHNIRNVFVTSMDIHPFDHIMAQSLAQRWISNSISKTINAPNDIIIKDIEYCYVLAWATDCKGITVYRDGSKHTQVLNNTSVDKRKNELKASDFTIKMIKENEKIPEDYKQELLRRCDYSSATTAAAEGGGFKPSEKEEIDWSKTPELKEIIPCCSKCGIQTPQAPNGACTICLGCGNSSGSCG